MSGDDRRPVTKLTSRSTPRRLLKPVSVCSWFHSWPGLPAPPWAGCCRGGLAAALPLGLLFVSMGTAGGAPGGCCEAASGCSGTRTHSAMLLSPARNYEQQHSRHL